MRNTVIINEAHSLLDEQKKLLYETFDSFGYLYVPKEGWSLYDQQRIARELVEEGGSVIFVSPVPVLLAYIGFYKGYGRAGLDIGQPFVGVNTDLYVFHNDHRDKKELPDGRIIQVVSQTGWQLVEIGGL